MPHDHRNALLLSYFTVGYKLLEGAASLLASFLAGSVALFGFGMDSFVESISGFIMIWRFSKHGKISHDEEEKVEKQAARLVGYSFLILAAYVLYESGRKLFLGEKPDPSLFGIIIAIASIIVMPILFILKHRTGKKISSKSLIADSRQTLGCVILSFALLIGLGLNLLFGFWQADPVIGLLTAGFFVKEGFEAIREQELCSC